MSPDSGDGAQDIFVFFTGMFARHDSVFARLRSQLLSTLHGHRRLYHRSPGFHGASPRRARDKTFTFIALSDHRHRRPKYDRPALVTPRRYSSPSPRRASPALRRP